MEPAWVGVKSGHPKGPEWNLSDGPYLLGQTWVPKRRPKWNPEKRNQGRKSAVPWWSNFDPEPPYPLGDFAALSLGGAPVVSL